MHDFTYRKGELYCEDVPVSQVARDVGTPIYIYSRRTLQDHFNKIRDAFADANPLVCYAVKANSSLAILRMFAEMGSGFDIVSGGELFYVLKAGADPQKVVFAGVGKTRAEIEFALAKGILHFNVESAEELEAINGIAVRLGKTARVTIRLNPDVDPNTHRHITTGTKTTKFGLDFQRVRKLLRQAQKFRGVSIRGFHFHLGSQILTPEPYRRAIDKVEEFVKGLNGMPIEYLSCGGGFGANYRGQEAPSVDRFAPAIVDGARHMGVKLALEPGRFIVANAGILVTQVQFVKESHQKTFVICDAGMNTLIRPALYEAFHRIWPVRARKPVDSLDWFKTYKKAPPGTKLVDVVGPICETGDYFAHDRPLPPVKRGDHLAVFTAGAYGMAMASHYNAHPLPAEVMVDGNAWRKIRHRETYDDLVRGQEL